MYSWKNIFERKHLEKVFLTALNNSLHTLLILECAEFTIATNVIE
jgi:hypothetical protein